MGKPERKIRAVIYARIAAQRVIFDESVEQMERCRDYIKAQGYELTGIYTDEGATGTHTDHPALNNLRADAAAGKIDRVVILDYSRITRNAKAVRAFLDEMSRLDVSVESVKGLKGGDALCQLVRIK